MARVGRNIDGLDLELFESSLQLLKKYQAEYEFWAFDFPPKQEIVTN